MLEAFQKLKEQNVQPGPGKNRWETTGADRIRSP